MNAQTENTPRTWTIDVWENESIWTWEGVASSLDEAEAAATAELNNDWDREYSTFYELSGDMSGTATRCYPSIMAERISAAELATLRDAAARNAVKPDDHHVAAVITAAQAMLDAFGGDTPDWIEAPASTLQSALGSYWAKREQVTAVPPQGDEMRAAGIEMAGLLVDALDAHIYSLDDGHVIPEDCAYVASINRVRAAAGLKPFVPAQTRGDN